jgi:3',5'-cyclic AMP phosphodiesterase CpdA
VRKIARVTAVVGLLLLGSGGFLGLVQVTSGHEPMPPLAGNSPPGGLQVLDSASPKCRIGVLGDAQKGIANLENIVRAVQAEQVDFIIQTGDLVSTNDEGHYRLVARALRRADLRVRFLVAPGNHDTKGGVQRFRQELGDDEFRFQRNGLVFLVLNNAFGAPPEIRHLEEALQHVDPGTGVVLAMHVPPFDLEGNVQKGYAPFLGWLEKSRVRYLLTGHVHGYFKKQIGGCTVVVNGVGGDSDSWQMDQKVYATILDVDGSSVTDHAVVLPPEHGLWENVVHLAVGHFSEGFRRNPVRCWGGTVLLGAVVGVSLGILRLRP